MNALNGYQVRLSQGDGADPEVFATVAGGRAPTFNLNNNPWDATTVDNITPGERAFRVRQAGMNDLEVPLTLLFKDKDTFDGLVQDVINGTVRNYQVDLEGFGAFEGPMIASNLSGDGSFDAEASYSLNFQSAGKFTFTAAP